MINVITEEWIAKYHMIADKKHLFEPRRFCDHCSTTINRAPVRATIWGKDYCRLCEPELRPLHWANTGNQK